MFLLLSIFPCLGSTFVHFIASLDYNLAFYCLSPKVEMEEAGKELVAHFLSFVSTFRYFSYFWAFCSSLGTTFGHLFGLLVPFWRILRWSRDWR